MAGRIGWIACGTPGCGNPEASVSETAAGTIAFGCHKCQASGYAKAGSKAARLFRQHMTPDADAEPAPKPEPAPAPAPADKKKPAPTPKPANSVFSLGNL